MAYYFIIVKLIVTHRSLHLFYPNGLLGCFSFNSLTSNYLVRLKYAVWLFAPLGIILPFWAAKKTLKNQIFWTAFPLMAVQLSAYGNADQVFDPGRWYHYSWYPVLLISFVNGLREMEAYVQFSHLKRLTIIFALLSSVALSIVMLKTNLSDFNTTEFIKMKDSWQENKLLHQFSKDKIVIGQWCLLPFLTEAKQLYHLGATFPNKNLEENVYIAISTKPSDNSYPLENIKSVLQELQKRCSSLVELSPTLFVFCCAPQTYNKIFLDDIKP